MKKIMASFFLLVIIQCNYLLGQDPNWNSNLMIKSYPSPYFNDWERDPSIGTITIGTLAGTPETEFYCILKIFLVSRSTSTPIIEGRTQTILTMPAGPQTQFYKYEDVVDWKDVDYDEETYNQILRSGRLPEGEYELLIDVYNNRQQGSLLTECSSNFYIVYPNPPELIYPTNGDAVTEPNPTFMWSPVNTPADYTINYHFKMVEKLEGQTPDKAIESNLIHFETDIVGIGTFTYPLDAFALESGKEYIWQITATDENGFAASSNNGKSIPWSFFYGVKKTQPAAFTLETLMLLQNNLVLKGVKAMMIAEDANLNAYILNGSTELEFNFNGTRKSFFVDVENLTFLKDSYNPPTFYSGKITALLNPGDFPESLTGPYFQPDNLEITFNPVPEIIVKGNLYLPGSGNSYPLIGTINYIDGAFSGQASAFGAPLFSFGDDNCRLDVNEASLHFSNPVVTFRGDLYLFNEKVDCAVPEIILNNSGDVAASITCNIQKEIQLIQGSDIFKINLARIEGDIHLNPLTNAFAYDFDASGGFNFNYNQLAGFGADIVFNLKPGSVDLVSFHPRGNAGIPPIDIGLLKILPQNITLEQLSFANGLWDFSLSSDMSLNFPAFGNSTLNQSGRINFSQNGFNLPEINLSGLNLPRANFDFINLMINALRIQPSTIDWASFNAGSFAGLNVALDLDLGFLNLPGNVSEEFRNMIINLPNLTFSNQGMNINLPDINIPGYNISLGGGIDFTLTGLSGNLNTDFSGGSLSVVPNIFLKGRLDLPQGLTCAGSSSLDIQPGLIQLSADGKLNGIVNNVIPACPINIGMFNLSVIESKLSFTTGTAQKAILEGKASLTMATQPGQSLAQASFAYDLIENKLLKLSAEIAAPFVINIPTENAVLSATINRAILDLNELTIDGRNNIRLTDGTTIGATFNNFKINPVDLRILSGNIIFDSKFALKAILQGDIPGFSTTSSESGLTEETALLLKLNPQSIICDKQGFGITGNAEVKLKYLGREFANLTAVFSNKFIFELNDFRIISGQCEIFSGSTRILVINRNGFVFENTGLFDLPERLPLLNEQIAYLKIKDNGILLIDISSVDGKLQLSTKPNSPIKMIIPALQFQQALPPEFDVSFNIRIDAIQQKVVDGSLRVVLPNNDESLDLSRYGIPFQINEIFFGNVDNINKFRFTAKTKLFGSVLDNNDRTDLILGEDGILSCEIRKNINKDFNLAGVNKVKLNVTSISGTLATQLVPFNLNFDFDLNTRFEIASSSAPYGLNAILGFTQSGFAIKDITSDNIDGKPIELRLDWMQLTLSDISLLSFSYTKNPGFHFNLKFDVGIKIPSLQFEIPQINDVSFTENGFSIPQISINNISNIYNTIAGIPIRLRNFRSDAFILNWFDLQNSLQNLPFAFDFSFKIPGLPANASSTLRNKIININSAKISNRCLVATIPEIILSATGVNLPINDNLIFLVKKLNGNLFADLDGQGLNLNMQGKIKLPQAFGCNNSGEVDFGNTGLSYVNGKLSGSVSGIIPQCPFNFGIGTFTCTNATFTFGAEACSLAVTGDLKILKSDGATFATGNGSLILNLFDASIIGGQITVPGPFAFQLPKTNPVLKFSVNSGELSSTGFKMNGEAHLLGNNVDVSAQFSNLKIDPRTFNILDGSLSITQNSALKISVGNGLQFGLVPTNYVLTETGIRLNLPSNISIDNDGIKIISGSTSSTIYWNGNLYGNNITCTFDNIVIGVNPFEVKSGSATLKRNNEEIAVLNSSGIVPKGGLDIQLPDKIPLPDLATAYIQIKDATGRLLVSAAPEGNGVRISGNNLKLVIPALKYNDAQNPEFDISLNWLVSAASGTLVNGSATLENLNKSLNGIPLVIKKVIINKTANGAFTLKGDGTLNLPQSLTGLACDFTNFGINQTGITGIIRCGVFSENPSVNNIPAYMKTLNVGDFTFNLQGALLDFNSTPKVFKLSGDITSDIFKRGNTKSPIHFKGEASSSEFNFTLALTEGYTASFGIANLKFINPTLNITGQGFNISSGGLLTFTNFGTLSISSERLNISNTGITFEDINISTPAAQQKFTAFGCNFVLRDTTGCKAIDFDYNSATKVLKASLCGRAYIMGKTIAFSNLGISTDGVITANAFLSQKLDLIPGCLSLTSIGITSNPLTIDINGEVKIPKPVNTTNVFSFSISADGKISGNSVFNKVIIAKEPQHLWGNDQTEYDLSFFKFDPTYADLHIDLTNMSNSSFRLVADVFFNDKRISLGSHTPQITPGLEIKFDGTIHWSGSGNLGDFDWDVIKFKNVSFGLETSNDFVISLSGTLSLALQGMGNGGVTFENLKINSSGEVLNFAEAIDGGSLSIAQVLTLTINNIEFSNTETTVNVQGGTIPTTTGGKGTPASTNVVMKRYLKFSGSLDIAGVFSGGVDEFFAYVKKEDNSKGLIINNLSLGIENVFSFNADLTYEQLGGNNFRFLLGGSGKLANQYNVALVGKIAKINNQPSFGFFVAGDCSITIPPCIILTGVGGGFFLNPEQSDINLVKNVAGLETVNSKVVSSPGSFAVFLFARAAIVDANLIKADAILLSITENYISVDGKITVLNQTNRITGTVHLAVGFTDAYAEGNININVALWELVNGSASLNAYFYGMDEWAIIGDINVELLHLLDANSHMYIGNEGFLFSFSVSASFDIWVIDIGAGLEGKIWYTRESSSYGAYCKAWIEASIFEDIVSAKGWMQFGLFGSQSDFYLYGIAGLEIDVLCFEWEGSVWAKINKDGVDGDVGSNKELSRLIANAKNAAKDMENAAQDAQRNIVNQQMAALQIPSSTLTGFFRNMYMQAQLGNDLGRAFITSEGNYGQPVPAEETNLFSWVHQNIWLAPGAPSWSSSPQNNGSELDRRIQSVGVANWEFDAARDADARRFANIIADPRLTELTRSDYVFSGDPVSGASFNLPQTNTVIVNGKVQKTIIGAHPNFNIDAAKATNNQNTFNQSIEDVNNFETSLIDKINLIETGLRNIDGNLGMLQGQQPLTGGLEYARILANTEILYRDISNYYTRLQRWAKNMKDQITAKQNDFDRIVSAKTRRIDRDRSLYNLTHFRLEKILQVSESSSDALDALETLWNNPATTDADKRAKCNEYGLNLWYNSNVTGLQDLFNQCTEILTQNTNKLNAEIESVNNVHAVYTAALDSLYNRRIAIVENLYDIYSQYYLWKNSMPANRRNNHLSLNDISGKKTELSNSLRVPDISTLGVNVTNNGNYSYAQCTWSASLNPFEYSISMIDANINSLVNSGFLTVGNISFIDKYLLRVSTQTNKNYTFYLRARSGAGYTNTRQANFSVEWSNIDIGTNSTAQIRRDNTAPLAPTIDLPYCYPKPFQAGPNQVTLYSYISNDPNKIFVKWSVFDNESGIISNQYKVTDNNNTEIIPWTSVGGSTDIMIQGLNLIQSRHYFVYVKSQNGDGLWSPEINRKEFVYDGTPPSRPVFNRVTTSSFNGYPGWSEPVAIPPIIPVPENVIEDDSPTQPQGGIVLAGLGSGFGVNLNNANNPLQQRGSLTVFWNASTDLESNVAYYESKLIKVNDPDPDADWDSLGIALSKTYSNLDYQRAYYIDVRAVNNLNLKSEVLRKGPYFPPDPTGPSAPEAAVSFGSVEGQAYIIFDTQSTDQESGVKGYQIAIGRNPGTVNVRNWNDTIDFRVSDLGPGNAWFIPNYNLSDGTYYLKVRGKNNQNQYSFHCNTGPYVIDHTPPTTPIVSISLVDNNTNLQIIIGGGADQQCSISKIEYLITGPGRQMRNWINTNLQRTIKIAKGSLGVGTFTVEARITNYVGLVSEVGSRTYTLR